MFFTTGGTSKQDISGASYHVPIWVNVNGHRKVPSRYIICICKWLIRSSLQTCLCSHQEERDPCVG